MNELFTFCLGMVETLGIFALAVASVIVILGGVVLVLRGVARLCEAAWKTPTASRI